MLASNQDKDAEKRKEIHSLLQEMHICLGKCKQKQLLVDIKNYLDSDKERVKEEHSKMVEGMKEASEFFNSETDKIFLTK